MQSQYEDDVLIKEKYRGPNTDHFLGLRLTQTQPEHDFHVRKQCRDQRSRQLLELEFHDLESSLNEPEEVADDPFADLQALLDEDQSGHHKLTRNSSDDKIRQNVVEEEEEQTLSGGTVETDTNYVGNKAFSNIPYTDLRIYDSERVHGDLDGLENSHSREWEPKHVDSTAVDDCHGIARIGSKRRAEPEFPKPKQGSCSSDQIEFVHTDSFLSHLSSSLLEQNRRIAKKRNRNESKIDAFGALSSRENSSKHRNLVLVAPQIMSIVGSRPKHWEARTATTRPIRAPRKKTLAAELARAAETPSLVLANTCCRVENTISVKPPSRVCPFGNSANTPETPGFSTNVSFAPSFLTQSTYEGNEVITVESPSRSMKTWGSPSPSRKRSSRTKNLCGDLSKRLKSIRDNIHGDSIRLRSGQYPFVATTVDRNDPRSRAKSFMDFTILGEKIPWKRKEMLGFVTMGYVHTYHHVEEGREECTNSPEAWILWTDDSARVLDLAVGSSFRIYDPIIIPLQHGTNLQRTASEEDTNDTDSERVVHSMVLCTQLCEPYSKALPTLPTVDTLMQKFH